MPRSHMTPEEFRKRGREVVDWIADYLEKIESFPVLSPVVPGEIRRRLPEAPPPAGEPFASVIRDLEEIILPGITHWQSPRFFGYFPANASGPAILGDLVSAGLGVQGMLWTTSPASTELETHVLDWLVQALDLPEEFSSRGRGGGVIQDTASSASLCALIAARERKTGYQSNRTGTTAGLTVYASEQAHSSIEKAVMIAGIGTDNLRAIPCDDAFALRPDRLESALRQDRVRGFEPCLVVATVGTTSSGAVDPIREIGEVCEDAEVWLHVDAAMLGSAAICPEHRGIHDGLELADSYCFNPHKWLLTNFDCDCFYVADRASLIRALSVLPEYLKNQATESGAVIDYRDWQVPLGRRFRALKLWFVIRHYGVEGLRAHIREHVHAAACFEEWIETAPDFELVVPRSSSLVCFRHRAGDAFNERLLAALNESGELFLTHTRLGDRYTLRFAVGATTTELRHVELAWATIQSTADRLRGSEGEVER